MKTVLDLIRKFDELNASKTREQDKFSLADEERWEELKAMYDLLVFHSGLGRDEDGASSRRKRFGNVSAMTASCAFPSTLTR